MLVHGILDGPGYMRDVGSFFAKNCYLVRAVLLDGMGTDPSHLNEVKLKEWTKAVEFRFEELKEEVDRTYLGGLSLGGGLVTHLAYRNYVAVKGLFLIAPSMRLFGSQEALGSIGYYTYLLNKDFINTIEREKNPAKYHAFSKKALGNLMNLHAKIRQYQEENTIKAPTFFCSNS